MEVMNVPQARSRISLAPSMVNTKKKGRGMYNNTPRPNNSNSLKTMVMPNNNPSMSGQGVGMDILKAVAPAVIDLASNYAKSKLGGMAMPIKMSPAQKRTLKKGGAITIKPAMISDVANEALALLPANAKKILGALNNNKSIRYALRQGEDLVNRMTGKGIMDLAMPIMKAVAPELINLASKKIRGEGVMDVLKDVAPVAIDLASNFAKKKLGGAMGIRSKKKSVMSSNGSPYVSLPYKRTMSDMMNKSNIGGGGIYPAGGAGIYPAGKSGCGMHGMGIDMPIQLGSPYINPNSPAMKPFMLERGIMSNNPIK